MASARVYTRVQLPQVRSVIPCVPRPLQFGASTQQSDGVECTVTIHRADPNPLLQPIHVPHVTAIAGAKLPMSAYTHFSLPNSATNGNYHALLPLGPDRTRWFWSHLRNYATAPALDFIARIAMNAVVQQDADIIHALQPFAVGQEVSLGSDRL